MRTASLVAGNCPVHYSVCTNSSTLQCTTLHVPHTQAPKHTRQGRPAARAGWLARAVRHWQQRAEAGGRARGDGWGPSTVGHFRACGGWVRGGERGWGTSQWALAYYEAAAAAAAHRHWQQQQQRTQHPLQPILGLASSPSHLPPTPSTALDTSSSWCVVGLEGRQEKRRQQPADNRDARARAPPPCFPLPFAPDLCSGLFSRTGRRRSIPVPEGGLDALGRLVDTVRAGGSGGHHHDALGLVHGRGMLTVLALWPLSGADQRTGKQIPQSAWA